MTVFNTSAVLNKKVGQFDPIVEVEKYRIHVIGPMAVTFSAPSYKVTDPDSPHNTVFPPITYTLAKNQIMEYLIHLRTSSNHV